MANEIHVDDKISMVCGVWCFENEVKVRSREEAGSFL